MNIVTCTIAGWALIAWAVIDPASFFFTVVAGLTISSIMVAKCKGRLP